MLLKTRNGLLAACLLVIIAVGGAVGLKQAGPASAQEDATPTLDPFQQAVATGVAQTLTAEVQPTATETPTPRPTSEIPVAVIGTSGIIIYDAPDRDAEQITSGWGGGRLPITGISADGNFYRVEHEGREGWISIFSPTEGDLNAVPVVEAEVPVADIGAFGANIRLLPFSDAPSLENVKGQQLPVTGVSEDGKYYRVEYEGEVGWVYKMWAEIKGDAEDLEVFEVPPTAIVGEYSVSLRAAPDKDAESIAKVKNAYVPITGISEDEMFYRVVYEDQEGWISALMVEAGGLNTVPVVEAEVPEMTTTTVTVPGDADWVDSGVSVEPDQTFNITAIGEVNAWPTCEGEGELSCASLVEQGFLDADCDHICANVVNGPEGSTILPALPDFPKPDADVWVLLGRIGSEAPFVVGRGGTFTAAHDGTLQFRINQNQPSIALGAFTVNIGLAKQEAEPTRTPRPTNTPPAPGSVLYEEDFEDGSANGMHGDTDRWRVETDDEGNQVYCNFDASEWTNIYIGRSDWTDYSVEMRLKFLEQYFGYGPELHARLIGFANGYKGQLGYHWSSANIGYSRGSDWQDLGGQDMYIKTDRWYTLRIEVVGDHIKYLVDRRQIANVRDQAFSRGYAGFASPPDGFICIDDMRVVALGESETAAAAPEPTRTPRPTSTPKPPTGFLDVMLEADFDTKELGAKYDDNWRIVEEEGNKIYCSPRRNEFHSVGFGSSSWKDYSVEARVRIEAEDEGWAAILTRLSSLWWGYRHGMGFGPDGSGAGQNYWGGDDTSYDDLGGRATSVRAEDWHVLRAEVEGDQVRIFLDDRLISDRTSAHRGIGFAAIEAGPDSRVCVDDIVVRSLDRSPEALAQAESATVTAGVNIRQGPGTSHAVIGGANAGDVVYIMEWNEDQSWAYVRRDANGLQGWLSADFLNVSSAEGAKVGYEISD